MTRKFKFLMGFIFFAVVYVWGALHHGTQMNTEIGRFDQLSSFAKTVRLSHYSLTFPRHQTPVYPLIQSVFYRSEWSDAEYFEVAKVVNVLLSLVFLFFIGRIFHQRFPTLVATNLFLIVAFTVFIFKASYVQPELLYFFLNFITFLLMIEMFLRPSVGKAVGLGAIAGLAYLTKAANLPGLVIFGVVKVMAEAFKAVLEKKWSPKPFLLLVLVAFSFMLFLWPYAKNTKRLYGSYFFNINSSFFIWHDNWQEAVVHARQLGPLENVPVGDRPSLTKYLQSHSFRQISERIFRGGAEMVLVAIMAYGYFEYFVAFLGLFLLFCFLTWPLVLQTIKRHRGLTAFTLLYFGLHLLLYAFYVPIAPGERFSLAQFLPAMYVLTWGSLRLSNGRRVPLFGRQVDLFSNFHTIVFLVLCLDITSILFKKLLWMHGGS